MPTVMKTAESITRTYSNIFFEMVLNMAKSIAMAAGTECHLSDASTSTKKIYYVSMDSIGYPGWCVAVTCWNGDSSVSNKISLDIYSSNSDGTPNLNDEYKIGDTFSTGMDNSENSYPYVAETCVMIHDSEKDTVIFDIHPGSTLNGTDLKNDRSSGISYIAFFAKDVNDGVLCGMGQGHIYAIRSGNNVSRLANNNDVAQRDNISIDSLHLTKMVNYLSPGCPEMKSAYVSVVRPLEAVETKRYVSTLYANGKRWGRAGYVESWSVDTTSHPGWVCYYPIEPFVNY